jgi:hypothetical protein
MEMNPQPQDVSPVEAVAEGRHREVMAPPTRSSPKADGVHGGLAMTGAALVGSLLVMYQISLTTRLLEQSRISPNRRQTAAPSEPV